MAPAAPSASPTTSNKPDDQPPNHEAPLAPSPTPAPTPPATGGSSIRDALDSAAFHTDGRVRNPVPTKLQGMTNNRNGNFAVMHIDLTGTKASDRNAAAKRTSEETEAQARRANQVGWQPVRRVKSVWHSDDPDHQANRSSEAAAATPPSRATVASTTPVAAAAAAAAAAAVAAAQPSGSPSEWLQTRIPAPHETKTEQARLLTLLRTLHPILVVDQLCKALAYFGGIPGAPPPTDGTFPSSASTNGPGSLLVNWLSEIFPAVEDFGAPGHSLNLPPLSSVAGQTGWDRQEASSGSGPPIGPVRRARGRPKGSKSSKVRKDKGIKKSRPPPSAAMPSEPLDGHQPPLVDGRDLGNGSSVANHPVPPPSTQVPGLTEAAAGSQVNPESGISSTPGARKRGRPKGSKNRPKEKPDASKKQPDLGATGPVPQVQNSDSPMPRTSSILQGAASVLPEEETNGSAPPTRGLSGGAARNEAPLPVTAADASSLPENGPAPSLYTGPFSQGHHHKGQASPQNSGLGSSATPHSRTAKRPAPYESQEAPTNQGFSVTQSMGSMSQDQLAKRRRISKETGQQQGIGVDSQTLSPDVTASPGLSHGFSSASPQLPASRGFDSHKSVNNRPSSVTMGSGQGLQQQQPPPPPPPPPQSQQQQTQQQQQQQAAPQRFYAQQSQHQSPSIGTADQQRHQGPVQTPGPPRPRSQMAGAYSAQRSAHLSPQMLYTPQQSPMSSQVGSLGHHGASLGRGGIGGSHHQYSQTMGRSNSGGGGAPAMAQQRGMAAARGHQPREGAGQGHGFHGQHQQATSQPNTIGSFHGYGEQSYLNMDYGLTERDVQDAAAVTALGSPSQLEAALSQAKMRDQHMFQSIGRQ